MRVSGLCLECYIRYSLVLGDNFPLHNQPPVETLDAVIVAWSMLIFKKKIGNANEFHTSAWNTLSTLSTSIFVFIYLNF